MVVLNLHFISVFLPKLYIPYVFSRELKLPPNHSDVENVFRCNLVFTQRRSSATGGELQINIRNEDMSIGRLVVVKHFGGLDTLTLPSDT